VPDKHLDQNTYYSMFNICLVVFLFFYADLFFSDPSDHSSMIM